MINLNFNYNNNYLKKIFSRMIKKYNQGKQKIIYELKKQRI